MNKFGTVAAAVVAGFAGQVLAADLITFAFSDLSASFVDGSRAFTAQAVAIPGALQTGGNVNRVDVVPSQTATFLPGFRATSSANVTINMTVAPTVIVVGGVNMRSATGSFTILSHDGDAITGNINGNWQDLGFGFSSFHGLITAGTINLASDSSAAFYGPGAATSFMYDGLPMGGLTGAFVELQLTSGIFFDSDFGGVPSQVSGVLVPAPASLAMLAMGGLTAARRRRR